MFHIVGTCDTQDDVSSFLETASVVYGSHHPVTLIIPPSLSVPSQISGEAQCEFLRREPDEPWLSALVRSVGTTEWMWIFHPLARPAAGAREAATFWLRENPDATVLYGDTLVTSRGRYVRRPRFSPIRMLSTGDIGTSVLLRADVLSAVSLSPADESFDAQWYALAVAAAGSASCHVPVIFDEFREPEAVVADCEGRRNVALRANNGLSVVGFSDSNLVIGGEVGDASVSVIIPSIGASANFPDGRHPALLTCVRSLVQTDWDRIREIVIVAGARMPEELLEEVASVIGEKLHVVHVEDPFSFSASCNAGAIAASGSHFLFLNDDVEATESGWLEQMLGLSMLPNVGCVGARLLFPDGTIQHAGIVLDGQKLEPNHIYMHLNPSDVDDPIASSCSEFSAVTGACLLISAHDFMEVGGFTPELPLNYNDVDLCLKVATVGKSSVSCNFTNLIHRESTTRVPTVTDEEVMFISSWRPWFLADPFVNMWG